MQLHSCAISVSGNCIDAIYRDGDTLPDDSLTIDAAGRLVMPGFIDVHCHGKLGYDFCDGSFEAIKAIGVAKLSEGVTSFLPTTLTLPEEDLAGAFRSAAAYSEAGVAGAKIIGVHLEGPSINPDYCGAQNSSYIRPPSLAEIERLHQIFPIAKLSYAPESEGAAELAAELRQRGITPSAVHSAASYEQFGHAHAQGLRDLSHFCNQMSPLHHREIGLVGAGLLHDDVFIELICDGEHICPEMLKLIFKTKGVEHIQLITDAIAASGLTDGDYMLGGLAIELRNASARLKSTGALAGSTVAFNRALQLASEVSELSLPELVTTTSWNQARSLGLKECGKLATGFKADIVILDHNFDITHTIVNGELRYSHNQP